jgi:hypothetical protein
MKKIRARDWAKGVLIDIAIQEDLFRSEKILRCVIRKHKVADPLIVFWIHIEGDDVVSCTIEET